MFIRIQAFICRDCVFLLVPGTCLKTKISRHNVNSQRTLTCQKYASDLAFKSCSLPLGIQNAEYSHRAFVNNVYYWCRIRIPLGLGPYFEKKTVFMLFFCCPLKYKKLYLWYKQQFPTLWMFLNNFKWMTLLDTFLFVPSKTLSLLY